MTLTSLCLVLAVSANYLYEGGDTMLQAHARRRILLLPLALLALLAPLLAGCGGSSSAAGLDDSHWNLSAFKAKDGGASPPLPGSAITMDISGNQLSGTGGCNNYSGSVAHDNGAFTVGQLAVTAKACSTPEGVMDQEQAYLKTLQTAKTYELDGDSLYLYDAAGAPVLGYVRSNATPLTSTLWRMTGYASGSDALIPAPQDTATLTVFNSNGQITGAMGQQTFNAPYKASNGAITISQPQSAGASGQMSAFLAALTSAKKYVISGSQLVLTGADGKPVAAFTDTAHAPTLAHTTWFLHKFNFGSGFAPVARALNVTLNFDGSGKLSGIVGCNSYQGTYGTGGARLGMGDIQVTQTTCSNEKDALAQEGQYPGLLPLGTGFGIFNTRLLLSKIDGSPLAEYIEIFERPALVGTTWRLLALRGGDGKLTQALGDTKVTAFFNGSGQLTGSAGCNTYQASYTASGNNLSIRTPSSTQKTCDSPSGVMEQEQRYLAGLPSVATFTVSGPYLQFFTRDGAVFALYQATPPSTEIPLVGTSWYLQNFQLATGAKGAVTNPRDYTLAFAAEGQMTIRADCNSGTGSYTADGKNISIKVLQMTQVACSASSLSQQFLGALGQVSTYQQTNSTLTLNAPSGVVLSFIPLR